MNRRVAALLVGAALGCRRALPPPSDCLAIDAPSAPLGFDAPVSIRVRSSCGNATAGRLTWRQIAGPALRAPATAEGGRLFSARTPTLAEVRPGPLPWGVIPLSPRTRGEIALEATWQDDRGGSVRRELRFALAARSRGLPNTPIGARVYLGGEGWRLISRPEASAATIDAQPGVASLVPDVAGDYRLADGRGRPLGLRSARYDETQLDCGRAGCHPSITDAAAESPMTTILARGLGPHPDGAGPAFGPTYPGCALACHATGEPELDDGGFTSVAAALGVPAGRASRWEDLPRPLRRLGGVGCLACHGPAALPQPSARWGVLRTDVCAVCHDAPPRYGHVLAWQSTGMAQADRDPRARHDRACAGCHTTWGFLAAPGGPVDRHPPDEAGTVGITCAACHAVHAGDAGPPTQALLRTPAPPPLLAEVATGALRARSAVCLGCHTPGLDAPLPSATAAALWLGRGGLDPRTGHPLSGSAPHANVAGGCVGCHSGGRAAVERGAGHAFEAPATSCLGCHPTPRSATDLNLRARRLWELAHGGAGPAPPPTAPVHAGDARIDRRTPLGRAVWDVLLVLEDPAAGAHNAPYARALLGAAEPIIAASAARPRRGETR